MRASQILTASLLALGLASFASAQDFEVGSTTTAKAGVAAASVQTLTERLDGVFSMPFDAKGGGFELKTHVLATAFPSPAGFTADVDTLAVTLVYDKPSTEIQGLKWTLGRFSVTEPTGLILTHPGDGFKLAFDYGPFDLKIVTAYTGLVFRSTSDITLTLTDQASSTALFASPRFIGSVEGSLALPGRHKLTLSALAQQDLNSRDSIVSDWATVYTSSKGGALDTQYVTLQATGPIPIDGALYYDTFGTFGAGSTLSWLEDSTSSTGYIYQYKPIVSFLAGGALTYYLPAFYSSSFSARVIAASGDSDATSTIEGNAKGDSNLFVPVTTTTLGTVFNPGLTNLIYYEIGGTFKPVAELPFTLGSKLLGFQRATSGVVNAPGVLRLGPTWMGEELDVTAGWRPFSDLTASLSAGAFLPTANTFTPGTNGAAFQFAVKTIVNLSL